MKTLYNFFNQCARRTHFLHKTTLLLLTALTLSGNVFAAWEGSGEGELQNGTWYVLYNKSGEIGTVGQKEYSLSGPGAQLTFKGTHTYLGAGNLKVTDGKTTLFNQNPGKQKWTSVTTESYGPYNVDVDATTIKFYTEAGATLYKTFSNVNVTMAQYLEAPNKTSMTCPAAELDMSPTFDTLYVSWCNVPAMTCSLTNNTAGYFKLEKVENNSEAGKYNTAMIIVSCKHETLGNHSAKLKITDSYNSYSKTITISSSTTLVTPTLQWSSDDDIYNAGDILTATNPVGLSVSLSVADADKSYVSCSDNTAFMLASKSGTVTITAHVTGDNTTYMTKDFTKVITITNLTKQTINWTRDLAHLKTTDANKTITLDATASSNLFVSYELQGDKTGLTLKENTQTHVWTLTYSAQACKNTTIIAKQNGNSEYAPAKSVSLPVKVIDPTQVCGNDETLINSTITFRSEEETYNIDVPESMHINIKRTISKYVTYSGYFKIEVYEGRNGSGKKLKTIAYTSDDINPSLSADIDLHDCLKAQSVKLITNVLYGYDVTSLTYTKQQFCNVSVSSLAFSTVPGTSTTANTFIVEYSNQPIYLSCNNSNYTISPTDFGDCGEHGNQSVSVTYTAGESAGVDNGVITIKDNTNKVLQTVNLSATVEKKKQTISSHNVQATYNTTDATDLTAETSAELEEGFTFLASNTQVAKIEGAHMTFLKSGKTDIYIKNEGSLIYAPAYDTIKNVEVKAVTPTITAPVAENLACYGTFSNSQLKNGKAVVTLRGQSNTEVNGDFTWREKTGTTISDKAGDYSYEVIFTPQDLGMYNADTFAIDVTVNLAESSLEIANATTIVSLPEDGAELDLMSLITRSNEADLNYTVTSDNAAYATINGNKFSAGEVGNYAIHATMAATDYYEGNEANFTIKVNEGITFGGDNDGQWTEENSPAATDRVIVNANVDVVGTVAVGSLTINPDNTLTIKNGGALTVGDKNSLSRGNYGNIIIEAGGKLVLNGGEVHLNDFTLQSTFDSENPMSGQVVNQHKIIMHGDAFFILDLDPSGTATYGWYDFAVPFPVDALHGITRWENNEWMTLTNEYHYAVMAYHEDLRARTKNGWKKITGILQPGQGYTITPGNEVNRYRFEMVAGNLLAAHGDYNLSASAEGDDTDRGWNSLGNGTMEYIALDNAPAGLVQMFDHQHNVYKTVIADESAFVVGAAYFVQVAESSVLNISSAGENATLRRAPQREQSNSDDTRIVLNLNANGKNLDMMVITCDDEATYNYTIGKDVQKMGKTTGASIARLWTSAKDANLCAYNAPYLNNQAIIPLNIYAPAAGEYTLALTNIPNEDVYLRRNGAIIWNMEMGDYSADFEAGTDDSYDLLVIRHAPNTATQIDAIDGENEKNGTIFVEKMIVDEQLYILRDGTLYDAQGRVVNKR